MGKLYELLAIEQDRKNNANKALGTAKNLFAKQEAYFDGMIKRYLPLEDGSDIIPDENKEMITTVKDELTTAMEAIISGIDAHLSKEQTNSADIAKSDFIVNGKNFGTFSATALLALEAHLSKIKEMYLAIPTLDTARKWNYDENEGVYKAEDEVKFRSVKRPKVIVKYEATEEHPAQTELLNLDFQVGKYITSYFSGKITPVQKKTLLKRLDEMIEAAKVARTKANDVEAKDVKLGQALFDFINEGIIG